MKNKRAFISFDYDNDEVLKTFLVGQSQNDDTPFDFVDGSIKQALIGDWKAKAKSRIKAADVVIVICGEKTDTAAGVRAELGIAQEEKIPYFLLWGYSGKECKAPTNAKATDKIYKWSWENLKNLIAGHR